MKKFENSKDDRKADAKGMKRTGMSKTAWEKSPQDKKMDTKGRKMMEKGKRK